MAGIGGSNASLIGDWTDLIPTPAKLYWDTIVRGKKEPITEADFSPSELEAMQSLIGMSQLRPGSAGRVSYPDYDPESQPGPMGLLNAPGRVANSLGQFGYQQTPEGGSLITDKYDFNPMFKKAGLAENALIGAGTLGFSPLHLLGEYLVPPGQGRDVRIKLPKRR